MEKEGLETNLFDVQTTITNLEDKKSQLEGLNQDLMNKTQALQGEPFYSTGTATITMLWYTQFHWA